MIDETTTQSIIDPTKEIRVIRSHRMPRTPIRRGRTIRTLAVIAVAVVAGSVVMPVQAERIPATVASAEVSQIQSLSARGSTVDRYQRAALSRKQKIEKTIAYAMAQRGDRYSWGATGPSRWDCSGLVMVAFKKGAGKSLPHFTGGMQKKGVKVSKKNMKRGDLIFPQRGHVGIYLGGGKMIHASSGKGKVVVAKVYGFYTARRVI
jgi:cell wall-associated NlpC family hydrolase